MNWRVRGVLIDRQMRVVLSWVGVIIALCGFFAFSLALKVRSYPVHPLYVSDAALRYRYARMAAAGQHIPETDPMIQAPEGLEVRSLLFLFQDRTVGFVYRLLLRINPSIHFDSYLRWFLCVFASIPVVAAFAVGSVVWRSHLAGIAAAALYAASIPAMERVIGNYLREEFALPFIFASFFFFLASLRTNEHRKRANLLGLLAGILVFLSLSSWHLSGFYLFTFLAGAALVTFMRADLKPVLRSLLYIVGFGIVAGVVNEPLRTRMFLVSLPMVTGYCLVILYALFLRFRISRRSSAIVLLILFSISVFLVFSLSPRKGEYGHVYSLLLSKVRFLLDKPSDPQLLPSDARLLWLGPFQSPSLSSFLLGFACLVAVACYPAVDILRRWAAGKASQGEALLLLMSVAYFVLYLLVRRLEVFLVFFLVIIITGLLRHSGRRRLAIVIPVLLVVFAFESHKAWTLLEPTPLKNAVLNIRRPEVEKPSIHDRDKAEIFRWIRAYTPEDAIILARFAVSPMVATYGERAAVLHPIFETKKIRDKVLECASSFYGSEEDLMTVCAKYGVDFVLYEANQLLDDSELGDRYLTDNLEVKTNCAAFLLHFRPEWLRYFSPVHQTDYFRVFAVRKTPGAQVPVYLRYSPQYDPTLFKVDSMGSVFSDSIVAVAWQSLERAFALAGRGSELLAQGHYPEARRALTEALEIMPRLDGARLALGECLRSMGLVELSAETYRTLIELDRYNVNAYLLLATRYKEQGLLEMAAETLEEGIIYAPSSEGLMYQLAATYLELGDTASAITKYESILVENPGRADIRRKIDELAR